MEALASCPNASDSSEITTKKRQRFSAFGCYPHPSLGRIQFFKMRTSKIPFFPNLFRLLLAVLVFAQLTLVSGSGEMQQGSLKGRWKIEKVSGYADTPLSEDEEYIGKTLSIEKNMALLGNFKEKLGPAERRDTQSASWSEEFRTKPETLGLPRWVMVYDLTFAKCILLSKRKLLLDLGGTWYSAAKLK